MNTSSPTATILKDASVAFHNARRSVYDGVRLLYIIHEENLWQAQYSAFGEYVEQECQISAGHASKLISLWKFYVVEGGVHQKQLVGIDADKLYLAAKLPTGTIEQRLVKAQEWNRRDLKDALAEDENGVDCQHPEDKRVVICGVCQRRVD